MKATSHLFPRGSSSLHGHPTVGMEVNRARKQCPDSAGPSAGQGSDTARGRVAGNSGPGRTGSAKMGLGHHAPPFKGRGHLADVGIGGEVSDFSQEAVKVVLT